MLDTLHDLLNEESARKLGIKFCLCCLAILAIGVAGLVCWFGWHTLWIEYPHGAMSVSIASLFFCYVTLTSYRKWRAVRERLKKYRSPGR